jgi:hypothetical protein
LKIINTTKNTELAADVLAADSLLLRMKGLLGRKEFRLGQGMILKPCNSVHTLFMRFAIDVLFLDKANSVVGMIEDMKPYRISKIYLKAYYVIELPAGTIKITNTRLLDSITLK